MSQLVVPQELWDREPVRGVARDRGRRVSCSLERGRAGCGLDRRLRLLIQRRAPGAAELGSDALLPRLAEERAAARIFSRIG